MSNPIAAILQALTPLQPAPSYQTPSYNPIGTPQVPYYPIGTPQVSSYNQSPLPYYNPTPVSSPLGGILNNPAVRPALFAGGGAALGSTIAGPLGGAIGAGAGPFVSNLLNQQKEPLQRVAIESGLAALGGGLGSTLGPLGAAAGAGAGGYFGYQLAGNYSPRGNGTYSPQRTGYDGSGYYSPRGNGTYSPQRTGSYSPRGNRMATGYYPPESTGVYYNGSYPL